MKKILIMFGAVLFVCLLASVKVGNAEETFVPRGSAVLTGIWSRYASSSNRAWPQIHVANTTSIDVRCRITVYDHDGNDISHLATILTGSSPDAGRQVIQSGAGEFPIPALSTRVYRIYLTTPGDYSMGHAVIEWACDDATLRKALIANVRQVHATSTNYLVSQFAVNGGQIF